MKRTIGILINIILTTTLYAQHPEFEIYLEPLNISSLGGLQSYAFGQNQGKWLIIGGRLDGLHRRQPWATFDVAGHNTSLIVVDPENGTSYSTPLTTLGTSLQEQLSSTNMEFYQNENYLYLMGGYGYSATLADHTTYSSLIAIDVPGTINAIINGLPITSFFRQYSDTIFQVTGGRLEKINSSYYLVGGQKFIGAYNPMGPTHGPGFEQKYTSQIRKFTINDDGTVLNYALTEIITDTNILHRRDFNVSPQILPDGTQGLTAFSGVFQRDIDLPFLSCVNIDSSGYSQQPGFSQYYNHYHCANISLYDSIYNSMQTVFFGGIAQYYDSSGILVLDNNVPFVKTIAKVVRDSLGNMAEYKLNATMPGFLGAGSEFIPLESIPTYTNHVIKLHNLSSDTNHIGYIYGGINSSQKNIFWINDGTQSSANHTIFKVHLIKNGLTGVNEINTHSIGSLKMEVYPNPNAGDFAVKFNLVKKEDVEIVLTNSDGKIIEKELLKNLGPGIHTFEKRIRKLKKGGIFFISIQTPSTNESLKLIITED